MEPIDTKISHEEWYERLCSSLTDSEVRSPFGDKLPRFPSEDLQRNTTSLCGVDALKQANGFYDDTVAALSMHGINIQPYWTVLDFGSCWGRISRFFMRDVPKQNIHGVDVEEEFVRICNELFESHAFSTCPALPPCSFGDLSVNLISAYSVFSHLSENAFLAWMQEFWRILKPGGIVALTTRNEAFLNYCASLGARKDELSGYPLALATMIGTNAGLRERYRAGEFAFITGRGMSGGGSMNDTFYGEAFIPLYYVQLRLGRNFEVLDYKAIGKTYDQALFVIKKR